MNDIARLLEEPGTTIAVVGATDDPDKFGGRIYRDLKAKGFRVFAVNPNRDTVDGDTAYPTLADLPEAPTIVNFVVPPPRTLRILEQCRELGLMNVWVQPGAESPEVLAALEEGGFHYLASSCIMVRSRVSA
ncbi:MAG: CoA-binding protein [Actinobacteria bacterium]|nr:CoA-binding protein [Actinomycetota bacterium]